jgi:hypothetical protein
MAFNGVINRGSMVSLDVTRPDIGNNGARVQQWEYNASPNQHWEFEDAGGGWVWLRNQESGKALDITHPDIGNNGAVAQQWDYNATPNQQWQRVDLGGGWFWLRNRESGKALDVHANNLAKNGANVQQWDYNGTTNQQWMRGGNTGSNRFVFGPFDFDPDHSAEQICTLLERHRFAFSRIGACGNLNANERQTLTQAYQRAIRHSVTTTPGINGYTYTNASQVWINFGVLFPQGANEIAQTLIHEMMHCAGFTHPDRTPSDQPFDNGPYYSTPPLRSEICIAGNQSDVLMALTAKAADESCSEENGRFTIRTS